MEAPAQLVVHATASHGAQRIDHHIERLPVPGPRIVAHEEIMGRWARKLGRSAESAAPGVEHAAERVESAVERIFRNQYSGGRSELRFIPQLLEHILARADDSLLIP